MATNKARRKYEYTHQFGEPLHTWSVVGDVAGIHLWIRGSRNNDAPREFHGGLEIHYRFPPDYMKGSAPSHDRCWLLDGPCWHDGSSLQATEFWIPRYKGAPHDHDRMLDLLEGDLANRKILPPWEIADD